MTFDSGGFNLVRDLLTSFIIAGVLYFFNWSTGKPFKNLRIFPLTAFIFVGYVLVYIRNLIWG